MSTGSSTLRDMGITANSVLASGSTGTGKNLRQVCEDGSRKHKPIETCLSSTQRV